MTPEMEAELFQAIGSIKTGIANLNQLLENHTAQDMDQFTAMTSTIKALDEKLDRITAEKVDKVISDFAVAAAVKTEQDKLTKKIAGVRAAWVSAAIGLVYTMMQIFIPMLWPHK